MMDAEHRCHEIDELLPWFVNRSLGDGDREQVRAHLEDCERCRDEAAWLAQLGGQLHDTAMKAVPATASGESYASLRGRIEDDRRQRQQKVLAIAAGLLLALGITLGVNLAWQPFAPRYQTVSDPVPPAHETLMLELELAPDAAVSSLYGILETHDAVIVAGPDAAGRVQLEFRLPDGRDAEELLDTLRGNAEVIRVSRVAGSRRAD